MTRRIPPGQAAPGHAAGSPRLVPEVAVRREARGPCYPRVAEMSKSMDPNAERSCGVSLAGWPCGARAAPCSSGHRGAERPTSRAQPPPCPNAPCLHNFARFSGLEREGESDRFALPPAGLSRRDAPWISPAATPPGSLPPRTGRRECANAGGSGGVGERDRGAPSRARGAPPRSLGPCQGDGPWRVCVLHAKGPGPGLGLGTLQSLDDCIFAAPTTAGVPGVGADPSARAPPVPLACAPSKRRVRLSGGAGRSGPKGTWVDLATPTLSVPARDGAAHPRRRRSRRKRPAPPGGAGHRST